MPISKKIERTLGVTVVVRDDQLKIIGTPSAASGAQEVFEQLYELAKRGKCYQRTECKLRTCSFAGTQRV